MFWVGGDAGGGCTIQHLNAVDAFGQQQQQQQKQQQQQQLTRAFTAMNVGDDKAREEVDASSELLLGTNTQTQSDETELESVQCSLGCGFKRSISIKRLKKAALDILV